MKLPKLSLSVLLLACVPACLAQNPAPAPASAAIRATITMRDPSALEVSYELPPSCAALDFHNDGMRPETVASLRSDWRAADDCIEFDGRQIRRKNPSCSTLRLRVPATNRPPTASIPGPTLSSKACTCTPAPTRCRRPAARSTGSSRLPAERWWSTA